MVKKIKPLIIGLIIFLFSLNALPYLTRSAGTLFVDRQQPPEYQALADYLQEQEGDFRTLWFPRYSQWSYFDANHPRVSAAAFYSDSIRLSLPAPATLNPFLTMLHPFEQNYGESLADAAMIRYFIVPLEDSQEQQRLFAYYDADRNQYISRLSKLPYLRRIYPEGVGEVAVFENQLSLPPVRSFRQLYGINAAISPDQQYAEQKADNNSWNFVKLPLQASAKPIQSSQVLTSLLTRAALQPAQIELNLPLEGFVPNQIQIQDENFRTLYQDKDDAGYQLKLKATSAELSLNDLTIFQGRQQDYPLYADPDGSTRRFVEINGRLSEPKAGSEVFVANLEDPSALVLYTLATESILQNGSFESGLWQEQVSDCHNYDESPDIAMRESSDNPADGQRALELITTRHMACTNQRQALEGGKPYLLQGQYRVINNNRVRVRVSYNDSEATVIERFFETNDADWASFELLLEPPADASEINLTLYSLENEEKPVSTWFDDIRLLPMPITATKHLYRDANLSSQDQPLALDNPTSTEPLNLIANGSFESGAWQKSVGDCHNYDNNPELAMWLDQAFVSEGQQSLVLSATRHIACTSLPDRAPLSDRYEYELLFDFQSDNASEAGYYLSFDDPESTVQQARVAISGGDWQTHSIRFSPPTGAKSMSLFLYGYPAADGRTEQITRYDHVRLYNRSLAPGDTVILPSNEKTAIELSQLNDNSILRLRHPAYTGENLFENPSFEDSLWGEKVGDCNNYDDNPAIAMKTSQIAQSGERALQLEATRHNACTSTLLELQPDTRYLIGFATRSEGETGPGYYLSFDDKDKTKIERRLSSTDNIWTTHQFMIDTPESFTQARLHVYAYESDRLQKNTVLYDDFFAIRLPEVADQIYLEQIPAATTAIPQATTQLNRKPTREEIQIDGATAAFFLTTDTQFNPGWDMRIEGSGFRIPEDFHYPLNGFLNAWYLDIPTLCGEQGLCTRNDDGSYDLELVIEYTPQRWFYLGGIISLITLLGLLSWLGWQERRRLRAGVQTLGSSAFWFGPWQTAATIVSGWIPRATSINAQPAQTPSPSPSPAAEHHPDRVPYAPVPDATPIPGTGREELDLTLVQEYEDTVRRLIDSSNPLLEMECLTPGGNLTRAGLLLFGRQPDRHFRSAYLSLVRYNDRHEMEHHEDIRGNLIRQVEATYAQLQRILPSKLAVDPADGKRKRMPAIPLVAIREVLMNAVAHRDYTIEGSRVIVAVFPNRIEVTSPGGLPNGITPETILRSQFNRNPVIAIVLNSLGYIEQLGSGMDRVFAVLEANGCPKPQIEDLGNQVVVTLFVSAKED